MLVGLGGNNGTTLLAGVLANKQWVSLFGDRRSRIIFAHLLPLSLLCSGITWNTKDGLKSPNYFGSLTQASTLRVGNFQGEEVFTPFKSLLPMVEPNDIVFGGWDISGLNLAGELRGAAAMRVFMLPCTQHANNPLSSRRCLPHAPISAVTC